MLLGPWHLGSTPAPYHSPGRAPAFCPSSAENPISPLLFWDTSCCILNPSWGWVHMEKAASAGLCPPASWQSGGKASFQTGHLSPSRPVGGPHWAQPQHPVSVDARSGFSTSTPLTFEAK